MLDGVSKVGEPSWDADNGTKNKDIEDIQVRLHLCKNPDGCSTQN